MKFGWPQPQRLAKLREIQEGAVTATFRVVFQGRQLDLPIRTVSIELPKYRLNNGRTEAAQLEYLATHSKEPSDLFSADLESDAAQEAQHAILSTMVNEQDLLAYFKERQQEDPLVLTHTGFVLNGNRRLCAFRMLYLENKGKYGHFANLQIAVLPSGDEKDWDRLESRLQREKDIRAPYPWYADAVKYKRRLEEFDIAEVEAMEGVSAKRIRELIAMLSLADKYLVFIQKPSEYRLLRGGPGGGNAEYAFKALNEGLGKFRNAEEQEAYTYTAFALIADAEGGRLHEAVPKLAEHFAHVEAILPEKVPSPAPGAASETSSLDALFGAKTSNSIASKIEFVKDLNNAENVRALARDMIEEREFFKRDKKKQNFVYEQARKAATLLKEAFNGVNKNAATDGVAQQLDEVEEYIKKLRAWIEQQP